MISNIDNASYRLVIYGLLCMLLVSCGSKTQAQYQEAVAFPGLSFSRPVDLQVPADGTGRIFVVEQRGVIRVFENVEAVQDAPIFLDIDMRVDGSGNEEGLLGLAFHPEYATNGFFYVNYTANEPNRTVVSRFSVSATDANEADPNSELVLLSFAQPYSNHNGGQLQFGPDGMLYVAVGDGGSGGDPQGHGQNRSTLLGSILRIDVDQPSDGLNYGIPPDNPFVGNGEGYREEIFAYGLRNPWRFSFDSETDRLWTGDVGQNAFEEISIIESGGNYGWNIMEGFSCYGSSNCNQDGLELPVHAYPHSNSNNSVSGGYVYRGSMMPSLFGKYVYADFVSGRIWALSEAQGVYSNELLLDTSFGISSFGVDGNGELLICGFDGKIHKLLSISTSVESPLDPMGALMSPGYPNPFSAVVHLPFEIEKSTRVAITIHDVLGRRVGSLLDRIVGPGQHTVSWAGLDDAGSLLSSGLYLVRLRSEYAVSTSAVVFQPL
ncbi:MAG: T9SS type A sorting domain-containing protein [Rhodothermales bacterium]|nr:T9SS type A sorting domain-containing protein [Rhodothermales bacterium]